MPNNTWSALAAGNWNVAGNWSLGTVPVAGDDVIFDATSVQGCTVDVSPSVNSVTIAAAYSGNITLLGQTLTVALGFSDDGTGTRNYGNGITANGASGTVHFGSTLGAVTATSCTLTLNGTTGMIIDDDKGITFKSLVLGASAVVTNSGGASPIFEGNSTLLTIGNNATITSNYQLVFYPTAAMTLFSIGSGVTLNGTGAYYIGTKTVGQIDIPTIAYTGSGIWTFVFGGSPFNYNLVGNLNLGTANASINATAGTECVFNTNTYNITCGILTFGGAAVGGKGVFNFGSGSHSVTALDNFNAVYTTGYCNVNLQTSQWSVAGNVTFGSNHTVNPGTSRITITNTSTITSNGKSVYNFVINAAARTITLADALNIAAGGSVTVTAFTAFAGNKYIIFAGSGSISIATAVSNRLRTAVAGSTITWNTGANIWTIPAYTANDWGGSASGKVMWRSSAPGTQYRISAPAGVVVYYMNPQDNWNSGADIDALSRTNLDSGNNIGWLFSKGGNAGNSRSRIAISMGM